MKKFLIILIAMMLLAPTASFAAAKKKRVGFINITYETKDSFVLKSKLFYPTTPQKVHPVVIMLHSIGYSSDYWEPLVKEFVQNGVAVFVVDLRGHGQSVYDSNFKISSWRYFTNKQFAKYPVDVSEILKYLAMNYKDISPTKYAIIGADIGANTAILASEKLVNKPKALVLMSPTRDFKGLYTPIAMTNLGNIPIMTIVSAKDRHSYSEAQTLKKFAQSTYDLKVYPAGGMGMLMLKVNPTMKNDIVNWTLPKIGVENKNTDKK